MCNFYFCNKINAIEERGDILHLFVEEIGPIQPQSRLSCAALFFWLSPH